MPCINGPKCNGCDNYWGWKEENKRKFEDWLIEQGKLPAREVPQENVPVNMGTSAYEMVEELRSKMK